MCYICTHLNPFNIPMLIHFLSAPLPVNKKIMSLNHGMVNFSKVQINCYTQMMDLKKNTLHKVCESKTMFVNKIQLNTTFVVALSQLPLLVYYITYVIQQMIKIQQYLMPKHL
jgi:hypothetical protein